MGKRSEHRECFSRLFTLFVLRHTYERAQVVHTVGKFYYYNPDVRRHSEKHFSEVLHIPFLFAGKGYFVELCNSVYKQCHLLAEAFFYVVDGICGVLHNVVQKRRTHGVHVHLHIRHNGCHGKGVGDVGSAGDALLVFVCIAGKFIGTADFVRVGVRIVRLYL